MTEPYSRVATRPAFVASNIITITSETGAGSTTLLDYLRSVLRPGPWRFVSGGTIMRGFAAERGMTIDEFAAYNRAHPKEGWDRRCDNVLAAFGRQNFTVIESRAHAFVPHAFHALLFCGLETRAARRHADRPGSSLPEVRKEIRARDENDRERYAKLYPGCLWPREDFHITLDTAACSAGEGCTRILRAHTAFQSLYRNDPYMRHDLIF